MTQHPPSSPQPKMGAHATSDNAGMENEGAAGGGGGGGAAAGGGGAGAKKRPPLVRPASKAQKDKHRAGLAEQAARNQLEAELKLQAGLQQAAATAALKKRLEQEEKSAAAEKREAEAALVSARKADAAKEWEREKAAEASRRPGSRACTGHGQEGCDCFFHTYISLNPHERMAVALDSETHQGTYGNTSYAAVQAAFARGGVAAARKHVAKNK